MFAIADRQNSGHMLHDRSRVRHLPIIYMMECHLSRREDRIDEYAALRSHRSGHSGYLPFGPASERWGRHMVMRLAECLLDIVRREHLTVDPGQTRGRVELDGLLEIAEMRVVRG